MVWDEEQEGEEFNDKPYSTLSGKTAKRGPSRPGMLYIVLGGAVLVLILLFAVFSTGSRDQQGDGYAEADVPARLAEIEKNLDSLEGLQQQINSLEERLVRLGESAGQQAEVPDMKLVSRMESNSEAIKEAMAKLSSIEKQLEGIEGKVEKIRSASAVKASSGKSAERAGTHVVEKGDTLYSIAKKYKVELDRLLRANGLDENSLIHPGEKLKIP